MKHLRLVYWRWCWRRHWDKHSNLRLHAELMGLSPRPPDLDYPGERACRLADRLNLLIFL